MDYRVVYITVGDAMQAETMARLLLDKKLAACCNIINSVRSLYRWQGKTCDDMEFLLVIKTRADKFEELKAVVLAAHPYSCPEIIALPIVAGHEPYLQWINESLAS